eukprot:13709172-Ditylum_brightwellii.AAC.1
MVGVQEKSAWAATATTGTFRRQKKMQDPRSRHISTACIIRFSQPRPRNSLKISTMKRPGLAVA